MDSSRPKLQVDPASLMMIVYIIIGVDPWWMLPRLVVAVLLVL
jgi:hypothetical protein